MFIQSNINIRSFLCWLILLLFANKSVSLEAGGLYHLSNAKSILTTSSEKGYTDIVRFKDKFFAVGTNGRIDCITESGEKIRVGSSCKYNLHCVISNEELIIAAGDQGAILYSSDGKNFKSGESGTEKSIHGIAIKNGLLIAGADGGTILTSTNGISWTVVPTAIKGNILSIVSSNSFFIGISDSGEIIKSFDGMKWDIQNYNKEYTGYNQHSKFRKIYASQNSIVIIGTHDDGSPSILFSSLGNVWTDREPIYQDEQGRFSCLTQRPNAITYDSERDQFIVACDHGELFSLPSCSKCDKYMKISDANLQALIYFDNRLLIVGDDYSVFIQRLY